MAKSLSSEQLQELDQYIFGQLKAGKVGALDPGEIPEHLKYLDPVFVDFGINVRIGLKFCSFDSKVALEFSDLDEMPREIYVSWDPHGNLEDYDLQLWPK